MAHTGLYFVWECLVHCGTAITDYNIPGTHKQQKLISYSFGVWEVQNQDTNRFGIWLKAHFIAGSLFAVSSKGGRAQEALWGSFIRGLISFMLTLTSWPPQAPRPGTIILTRFQHLNFGAHTNIWHVAFGALISPWVPAVPSLGMYQDTVKLWGHMAFCV
jgi:hypothetical protein